jgi:hypothetical protein
MRSLDIFVVGQNQRRRAVWVVPPLKEEDRRPEVESEFGGQEIRVIQSTQAARLVLEAAQPITVQGKRAGQNLVMFMVNRRALVVRGCLRVFGSRNILTSGLEKSPPATPEGSFLF